MCESYEPKTKNIVSLLLLLAMLMSFFSCADEPESEIPVTTTTADVPTTTAPTESTPPETEPEFTSDKLSPDLDFGNATVTTLYWSDVEKQEYFSDGISGELINDAIFKRNQKVEERLKVKLNYVGTLGNYGNQAAYVTHAETSIMAGTHEYDILSSYSMTVGTLAYRHLVVNLLDYPVIDLEQPWWPNSLISEATINQKLYFVSGDISTMMLHMMYATFFNKDILINQGLESPYDLVQRNEWTLDKMISMCKGVYADLDGDNVKSENDQYGCAVTLINIDGYFASSGIKLIGKDANGTPIISPTFGSEKTQSIIETLCNFFNNTNDGILTESNGFMKGLVLFRNDRAYLAYNKLRDVDFEFGVVPNPKYDTAQQNYITLIGFPCSLYAISTDSIDFERAATVLECLASESYRTVTPALFEESMKVRFARDNITAQMYDIIRKSVSFDLGRIYSANFSNYDNSIFRNCIKNNDTTFISRYKSYDKMFNNILSRLLKSIEAEYSAKQSNKNKESVHSNALFVLVSSMNFPLTQSVRQNKRTRRLPKEIAPPCPRKNASATSFRETGGFYFINFHKG